MSFAKFISLFVFLVFTVPDVHGEEPIAISKTTVNELITLSELNTIDIVYPAMLKNIINQKKRDSCNEKPDCIAKWTEVEKRLLKEESAEVAKARDQMSELLMTRYSKDQLAWLLRTYNTPLLKDFRNFANSKESAGPLSNMRSLLGEKIKKAEISASGPTGKK